MKDYINAEIYYLKAIDAAVSTDASYYLALTYMSLAKNHEQTLTLIRQSYELKKNRENVYFYTLVLLWNEEFSKSYEVFDEWMLYEKTDSSIKEITLYLVLLIAKDQLYKAKSLFENEQYQFKDKLKPIWYALMTLMQADFPHEIKRMGSELQESVNSILEEIEQMKVKYKI